MYEEESHYYIDVLCDDFCEIANNNEIVFVEDESQQAESTANFGKATGGISNTSKENTENRSGSISFDETEQE